MKLQQRFSSIRGLAFASVLTLGLSTTPAQASDTALKFAAVGGTLFTAAYALWEGSSWDDCGHSGWRALAGGFKDKELRSEMVGVDGSRCDLTTAGGWNLNWRPEFSATDWQARGDVTGAKNAIDLAATPMFEWDHPLSGAWRFQSRLGIGADWLDHPEIGNRHKSTQYQFADRVGMGVGTETVRLELVYRHLSNADIKRPNNGVDFKGLVLSVGL